MMPYNLNIREEELKNKIADDYFWLFDTTKIIGNIDFCVAIYQESDSVECTSLLWAEAKKGVSDIYHSLIQLVLTIGKARTFDKNLPPLFLGAFDAEKMAFIPYNDLQDIFYVNDFNWHVTPSNHDTKEFKTLHEKIKHILTHSALLYYFDKDSKELHQFITANFNAGNHGTTKTRIDKNNFIVIYNKWLQAVKPTISVNWDIAKQKGVIDGDFYLADLLSGDNITLKEKLFVVLKSSKYELNRHKDEYGAFISSSVEFTDAQKAHTQFWNKYQRPPLEHYWDYIIERRDLLVPQDVRERKGSFFTPQIWVELSQKYMTDVLGENWQDEYYIWDCAAGTGNLLNGLTNKYHIWASTLDKQDVDVMRDRIKNGANLLEDHVFQFDFLNDDFTKLPLTLQDIINNPATRKKLVIYINPPYAEATNATTIVGTGQNKAGVSTAHKLNQYFNPMIGNATNEVFALFMAQVIDKIPDCILGQFSTLKFIQGSNFKKFKEFFKAKFLKGFIIPANSFDNVKGSFPIGFTIWNTNEKKDIKKITCHVYDNSNVKLGKKYFYGNLPKSINKWMNEFCYGLESRLGFLVGCPPDFQHNNQLAIISEPQKRYCLSINEKNLIHFTVYFAVRQCIKATWVNNRDQFLYPNKKWEHDTEFQNDCLSFTLFHSQNKITCQAGINHWIPFTEYVVGAREKFKSNFMTDFIKGKDPYPKIVSEPPIELFGNQKIERTTPLVFSKTAQEVFNAGLKLWQYYHEQPNCNVNAALYDIKAHFQGRSTSGKMNNVSQDNTYTKLLSNLKDTLNILAQKIEPKVYEYGFLLE